MSYLFTLRTIITYQYLVSCYGDYLIVSLNRHHDFSRRRLCGAGILNFAFRLLLECKQLTVVLSYSVYTASLEGHPTVA